MEDFLDFFKQKKNLANLLLLGILVLALPLGVQLIRQQQIIKSRAIADPIVFVGDNVEQKDGKWIAKKPQISLELTSTLSQRGSPTPTQSPISSPTSSPTFLPTSSPSYNTFNIGVNATGITHYGYGDLLQYSSSQDVDAILSEMRRMNAKIIRVFVANDRISADEAARRLDSFLTKAASYNISVIASLINFYGDTGFNPQGTQKYYTDSWNGILLLNNDFFANGYKQEYLSFLRTVVAYNKNHTNIYAWEVGNELKDDTSPQTFVDFMKDVTREIKANAPNHYVATGMINAAHASLTPEQLYPNLPDVDVITIHNYNGSRDGLSDMSWGLSNGKVVISEEMGFEGTGDRSSLVRQELDFWKSQGVKAVLQWGFLAKGLNDNGNGDRILGMDTIWHTDYDQLAALFTSFNQ